MSDKPKRLQNQDRKNKLWQDRTICFDINYNKLKCRSGEQVITKFEKVEDTKGNNGQLGYLIVTNLRILWVANKLDKINLSVGFNNIININVKTVNSKLRGGSVKSLVLICQSTSVEKTRYEFQFTILTDTSTGLKDSSIHNVLKTVKTAYESTRLFRESKLRAVGVIKANINNIQSNFNNSLNLLASEMILKIQDSVWSLSTDTGNVGSLILTNIRILWVAKLVSDYVMSIPWSDVLTISIGNSKFDKALVIKTFCKNINDNLKMDKYNGYTLGYKLNVDDLDNVYDEMTKLLATFRTNPCLGIDPDNDIMFKTLINETKIREGFLGQEEKKTQSFDKLAKMGVNEEEYYDGQINDIKNSDYIDDNIKAKNYETMESSDQTLDQDLKYFYCQEIGFAVEELKPGQAISSLWKYDLPDLDLDI